MLNSGHEVWCTISGSDRDDILGQIDDLKQWGVKAIEFRLDLVPESLWDFVFSLGNLGVPWWIAHFGTGSEADAAKHCIRETLKSESEGCIFHSRCEYVHDLIAMSREANRPFAAPYHSQLPLTRDEALQEFEYQESLAPAFRKIAVRAMNYDQAAALVEATRIASQDGGTPVVGAVFGTQRWARVVLPHAGSAITFIVAHKVANEVGGDDQQLRIEDLNLLCEVPDLMSFGPVPQLAGASR